MRNGDRFFTDAEIRSLLRAIRAKAIRGRLQDKVDHALVAFAWATGCRAGEIASVSIDPEQPNHIDTESGVVVIRKAKWDSTGTVPLDAGSLRTIRRYIRDMRPLIRNADRLDRLFITRIGSPYTPNGMTKKISMILTRYGFPDKTAHSFRHHFCTDLLRRGAKLHEARSLMRHRDVRSTMVYTHPTVDDLRNAVNRRSRHFEAG